MLNLDHDEARALHRIVRAMHDGECPKCHTVHPSDKMRVGVHYLSDPHREWRCPSCGFTISQAEADDVFRIFAPFMERNLAVFEKWRASRAASPPSPAQAVSEPHPEDTCEKCGGANIAWFVASPLWNKYIRAAGHPEILCPLCFAKIAEASGCEPTAWELVPENPPEQAASEPQQAGERAKRVTEGVRDMLAILESADATEDEKDMAASTIVEAVAPDIMEKAYGDAIRAWDAPSPAPAASDDDDCEPPDQRCQCAECDQEAVGFDEGTPFCAEHYRSRPAGLAAKHETVKHYFTF